MGINAIMVFEIEAGLGKIGTGAILIKAGAIEIEAENFLIKADYI